MHERSLTETDESYTLPAELPVRRMAISALSYRAIAQRREVQLNDFLGEDGAELLSDLMATVTNETSTQLMLTEHLLKAGGPGSASSRRSGTTKNSYARSRSRTDRAVSR
jgi:hypothetical protein